MVNFLKAYFSPEKRITRLEKKLQKAILEKNQQKINLIFCEGVKLLLREKRSQLLSSFVVSYCHKLENVTTEKQISLGQIKQAISILLENKYDTAALALCDLFGCDIEALDILAKRGRANELSMRLSRDNNIDKELLRTVVVTWEKYNGDIGNSSTLGNVLISIAKFTPESIPDNPRVREIIGQFKEAANLYLKEGNLKNAARCYELAGEYSNACNIYEMIGDNENVSRMAESLGDFEKALKLVLNSDRKIRLLIRMEKFDQAREYAAGLESPSEYFDLIKEKAKNRLEIMKRSHDYIGALEMADIAECEVVEIDEILLLGRQHYERKIASAASEEDIRSIYRDKLKLEEKAGYYEEAGRIAEDVLLDLNLASILYEKANLFNRAIETASEHFESQDDQTAASMRLAELHRKGGNLLRAAKIYETAGQYDKAFELYESIQQFNKAIECYLKTSNPSQNILIRLYTAAGEFEKVVEIHMESGSFADLEKALSIATTNQLTSHIRVIREKMVGFALGSKKDLQNCFNIAKDEVLGSYSPIMGIDFGTTNSVAAIFNTKKSKVEIILNSRGSAFIPSFFGLDENNHPIFGEEAQLRSLTHPDCVVARVKRSIGEQKHFLIKGKQFGCEEIIANFLQHIRSNAEAYIQSKVEARFYELLESRGLKFPSETLMAFLNTQKGDIHIGEVVLTVPAYFNDNQKRATRDSAEVAGFKVKRLLHEPTAAALAYGYQKPYSGKLAVIDLGGGTLDISVVEIGEGVSDVQVIGGDTKLGGSDLDALLVQHAIKNIKEIWGIEVNKNSYPIEFARLQAGCEKLKIDLSSLSQSTMELTHFLNKTRYELTLSRTELESFSKPILDRIKAIIEKTLQEYGAKIDNFLLVGNATKMPAINDLAGRIIIAKQLKGIDPGNVVATGAALEGAILARKLKQIILLDIVPYSLGIKVFKDESVGEVFNKLIEKNSSIPITRSDIFTTKEDNQPNVRIQVYQGESSQPQMNYFLGDFFLEVLPAPAHTPQIQVIFDISVDCILTVTAKDKATGKQQSIKIERAAVLSPQEKQNMTTYFTQRESIYIFEKELEHVRKDVDAMEKFCVEAIKTAERLIKDFFEQFHEKVEVSPQLYKVNPDHIKEIQDMFIQKDQFIHGIPKYKDQLVSITHNLEQTEKRHLDFSDNDIASKLKERIEALSYYKQAFENVIQTVEKNVTAIVTNWIQVLRSVEPDSEKMNPLEVANYHLTAGRADQAREILESLASSTEGLRKETFQLLLKCYVRLGAKDEYREAHKRFGNLFGAVYPDFNHLNSFLKIVDESVFLIQGVSQHHGAFSGSGFCISSNLIVTNRHVVEGATPSSINIIGKNKTYGVDKLELDPTHDLAILTICNAQKPFRLGEFNFVEPGEQILAIGFLAPSSNIHSENIYISRGIVNSIRNIEASPERVIFIDAKIGSGMSGGPLINDLGEVVGIVTFSVVYSVRQNEKGASFVEDQPVALPIHLVRKYIE
jgi:molecular chaperone DnaK